MTHTDRGWIEETGAALVCRRSVAFIIGREHDCHLALASNSVSRHRCVLLAWAGRPRAATNLIETLGRVTALAPVIDLPQDKLPEIIKALS